MMIFENREIHCILEVLRLLQSGESKYSTMFKTAKVSHTTLQNVLTELVAKNMITKHDVGHRKVNYEITGKGRKLLDLMVKTQKLV